MKILILLLFSITSVTFSQVDFVNYFENKTLRIDYFHTGDSLNDSYSIDELKEEPYWGGSRTSLVDTFNYGRYEVKVFDQEENKLIYSRTYSTLFDEWQTTDEARHTTKTFSETVTMPFPKEKIRIEFYSRDKKNIPHKKFEYPVDPDNYFISTERHLEYPSFKVIYNGDPAVKVDIVMLPEGYTEDEMNKFKDDCRKFASYLFAVSPYSENKDKFNIWGVEAPSPEEGTDIPADGVWKKTLLNSSFYTFDLERYLMTSDYKSVRDLAANAPYDQIYILVNSGKYGGGAIYNYYSVCVSNNIFSEYVFSHEFGHGFSFLADEYYTSDVAYNDFYPLDVEPLEPNITTLINFSAKWQDMVDKNTPIPTPDIPEYRNKVGAFEGGGYVAKGIYRPMQDCSMKTATVNNFCPVCRRAIQQMIDFLTN
jgi:hypothetical protein